MIKKITGIIIFLLLMAMGKYAWAGYTTPLSAEVFRLHVIANSDDPADQALKLEVKEQIVKQLGKEFKELTAMKQARDQAERDIPRIKSVAEEVIHSHGYNYPVNVYVGEFEFPTKSYGNMVFPQGEYQALRVVIGSGQGKNWWCVLFPPLCVVSSTDQGLSLASPEQARVSLKCLELLPKGVICRFTK